MWKTELGFEAVWFAGRLEGFAGVAGAVVQQQHCRPIVAVHFSSCCQFRQGDVREPQIGEVGIDESLGLVMNSVQSLSLCSRSARARPFRIASESISRVGVSREASFI